MASRYPGEGLFAHFPPPAECLAILVGCSELIISGIGGLSDAKAFGKGYGLEIDAVEDENKALTQNQKTQKGLVQAVSFRNIQNGALILTLACYTRDRRSLGFAVLYGALSSLADAAIVKKYGYEALASAHGITMINYLAVGASLLYWGRNDPWPFTRS
ncbi:hypothetical protein CB0940_08770 [Cercospora beticola]|uniref:DUF4267 domain-containing protein n=1 Tax=Cercospora beticola TaxID=122368 RepID=A0A2G5HP45_CERBT|nr:hypothetical protein CB0940_08770 [Cercospora beticola]PIA94288.1 hypothetical protein CB0940_08770 [Cercospora beticola]WPB05353.1 hypothetical protein RHO25_010005 [Cercospora beticola]